MSITTGEMVSLAELKELAQRLPADSALKSLILSEPDSLPRSECLAKLDIFVKLLHREAKNLETAQREGRFLRTDVGVWYSEMLWRITSMKDSLAPFVSSPQTVKLAKLKELAKKSLPEKSMARMLIMEKPDEITRDELISLGRMVHKEMAILHKMKLPDQLVEDLMEVMDSLLGDAAGG